MVCPSDDFYSLELIDEFYNLIKIEENGRKLVSTIRIVQVTFDVEAISRAFNIPNVGTVHIDDDVVNYI